MMDSAADKWIELRLNKWAMRHFISSRYRRQHVGFCVVRYTAAREGRIKEIDNL